MRSEDSERLSEYVAGELKSRRKSEARHINWSRRNFRAVMELYECAEKDEAAFLNLIDGADSGFVRENMRYMGVIDFESLKSRAELIRRDAKILGTLCRDGRAGISDGDFSELLRVKRESASFLTALMAEFAGSYDDSFTAKNELLECLEIIRPKYVFSLYSVLLETLAPDSVRRPKSQIEELKAELESAYIRLNSSEEELERLRQEGSELAAIDFLAKMNSPESEMLLDQFAKAERTLKQLSSSGSEIPPELLSVSLCVRIFMRTMRDVFRVSPVHEIGRRLTLTLEQSESCDYRGSPFTEPGETKRVEVISPGWRYGQEIFSLPRVLECSD